MLSFLQVACLPVRGKNFYQVLRNEDAWQDFKL